MRIGRRNLNTWRKPAQVPLRRPQIPHVLAWDTTRVAAVGSRELTNQKEKLDLSGNKVSQA
jgi:hypothetical protein